MNNEELVAIVDDDPAVREAISLMLQAVKIRALTYENALEFLSDPQSEACGCVVLDVRLPGMGGMELQRRLKEQGRDLAVIFVTRHGDVKLAVEAMREGAMDFIEKPFNEQQLLQRIQQSLEQWRIRLRQRQAEDVLAARVASLTPRESQVLKQLLKGHSSKEIAALLGVSPKTIEEHRSNVLRKMRVASTAELLRQLAGRRRTLAREEKSAQEALV